MTIKWLIFVLTIFVSLSTTQVRAGKNNDVKEVNDAVNRKIRSVHRGYENVEGKRKTFRYPEIDPQERNGIDVQWLADVENVREEKLTKDLKYFLRMLPNKNVSSDVSDTDVLNIENKQRSESKKIGIHKHIERIGRRLRLPDSSESSEESDSFEFSYEDLPRPVKRPTTTHKRTKTHHHGTTETEDHETTETQDLESTETQDQETTNTRHNKTKRPHHHKPTRLHRRKTTKKPHHKPTKKPRHKPTKTLRRKRTKKHRHKPTKTHRHKSTKKHHHKPTKTHHHKTTTAPEINDWTTAPSYGWATAPDYDLTTAPYGRLTPRPYDGWEPDDD